MDLLPELPSLAKRIVLIGGSLHEPGNAGAGQRIHFFCDPMAARKVLLSDARVTLIPLDVMRQVLFSPSDFSILPAEIRAPARFCGKLCRSGIAATSNMYGLEGFHLKDVARHRRGVAGRTFAEDQVDAPWTWRRVAN